MRQGESPRQGHLPAGQTVYYSVTYSPDDLHGGCDLKDPSNGGPGIFVSVIATVTWECRATPKPASKPTTASPVK